MAAGDGNKCHALGHHVHRTFQATYTCDSPIIELHRYVSCSVFTQKETKDGEKIKIANSIRRRCKCVRVRLKYLAKIHGRLGWNEMPLTRADFDSKLTSILAQFEFDSLNSVRILIFNFSRRLLLVDQYLFLKKHFITDKTIPKLSLDWPQYWNFIRFVTSFSLDTSHKHTSEDLIECTQYTHTRIHRQSIDMSYTTQHSTAHLTE